VDTYLTIASKRDSDGRKPASESIPEEVVGRILDAGRLTGNSQNKQTWRFLVVESPERRERLAEAVYAPANVRGAALVVAIAGARAFDVGRCVQSMMLAAWNDGVASIPNGVNDGEAAAEALGLEEPPVIVLTFAYPAKPRDPRRRTAAEWSSRANRKPLDELVERL
jgi:nitroreductase